MLRALIVFGLIAAAVAKPSIVRTKEDIESFRQYLLNLRDASPDIDGAQFLARSNLAPLANPEENSGMFQGDIIVDDLLIDALLEQYAMGRNAYIWPNTKWPENTVVWEFGEDEFGPLQQAAILDAIAHIENSTCVKFRYREPEDVNFVRLTGLAAGCYAHVGYGANRGVHTLNLARNYPGVGCFRHATIVHEWMHILGFLHMHSTYDRDDYVEIKWENIMSGTEHNFDIYGPDLVSNLGVEYDYISCLQYGPYGFSTNGEATIVAIREHEGVMGQRDFVTDKDWLRINRHYNCPGAWD